MAESINTTDVANSAVPHATVEVDNTVKNDSSYGNEFFKYTASITSSVLSFRSENGRTYHGYRDGAYYMPNDPEEQNRLDIMHELMLSMMDRKLFLAPISAPGRVLDLGTGTGIWAIDFADDFCDAEVVGIDLSPIQPSLIPPNVRFLIDDFDDEWLEGEFDFIHGRYLAGASRDFPELFRKCYQHTAPGGWVEFQEWEMKTISEDQSTKGTWIENYYKIINEEYSKIGRPIDIGPNLESWLHDAGFKNIRVEKYLVPMGIWPKDEALKTQGACNLMEAETGFQAGAMAVLTRHAGWKKEEVNILAAKALKDARDPDIHTLFNFYVVFGQKEK